MNRLTWAGGCGVERLQGMRYVMRYRKITHVLAAIRVLNRLELVSEILWAALNDLATAVPQWLRALAPPAWYARYSRRIEDTRLPQSKAERAAYAQTVGE